MGRRAIVFALSVVVLLTWTTVPAEGRVYDESRIDPVLAREASGDPSRQFDVIVRAQSPHAATAGERIARARDAVARHGGSTKFSLGIVGGAAARVAGAAVLALTRDPLVDYIYRDTPLAATFDPVNDAPKAISPGVLDTYANYGWSYYNLCGRGVTVAVVDSGIYAHPDLAGRIVAAVDFTQDPPVVSTTPLSDPGGHGTHVAGLVAGDGTASGGAYTGTAPCANIVDVRVLDAFGQSTTSVVLRGLQWVLANRRTYGIRIVNLSLGGRVTSTYRRDALSVAAEALVFAGVNVVAAAGNGGPNSASILAPANDPFVLSVGALDDMGTVKPSDDVVATFSARGPTLYDNAVKPDLIAPGRKLVSLLSPGSTIAAQYPDRLVTSSGATSPQYLRLSGTSMAAPLVAGIIALMLEKEPSLSPWQVRFRLKLGVRKLNKVAPFDCGSGEATVGPLFLTDLTSQYVANPLADVLAQELYTALYGQPLQWRSMGYNGGVDSRGVEWPQVTWDNVTWDGITWENIAWEQFDWTNIAWENIAWELLPTGFTDTRTTLDVTSTRWQLVD